MAQQQDELLRLHEQHTGVLRIAGELPVTNREQLGQAYTPGVAKLAKLIEQDPATKAKYTISGKLVAVITDGTAILGLGNVGPAAGLPIVEGKALLYKQLAGVDAIPLTLQQVKTDELVQTIVNFADSFAGIHLEDIKAPRVFEVEDQLKQKLNIPVYNDDQTGTAIVVLAGLINAAKVVHKNLVDLKIVINGVGAAGVATAKLLLAAGIKNITLVDIHGVIQSSDERYNHYQRDLAAQVSPATGTTLDEVITGQDVFIGLSVADVLNAQQVHKMSTDPIIFALANPVPEINPEQALQAGAKIVATGSSQWANQVNNILVFPGLFQGLLRYDVKQVDLKLQQSVAVKLAALIKEPSAQEIVPGVFSSGVVAAVSSAVEEYQK
ncbi:NAD(P)-dependent malic enzyme [Bombilactobacillus thymidiniphilus]|uniref:NAD-dependent malic enzyme n=1 Tax=Bombilactobacillus thymidiniphilus TaxID=2923363 RepID=A0ABY4PC42_9LACO|nr:malic enzyme-like NAD(P)-binding protein [Bombilactobacillus thymidiniphilus]UQS83160.1 NAD-dependent malic enzyme [Bombilactobacillus thymidiniphilus]